jgi:cystathionine beta-lyase/cystathionine gamma-synthase
MSLKKLDDRAYSIPTRLLYGESPNVNWNYSFHVVPPITASSTFRLESASRGAQGFGQIGQADLGPGGPIYVYDRMGEPNNNMLEQALAIAEEAECAVTYSTGMAAVHAALTFALEKSSEIIAHRTLYGCTFSLLTQWMPTYGIPVHFADLRDASQIAALANDRTRVVYLESPVNPTLELIDIKAVVNAVAAINQNRPADKRIITIIDNTFCTPWGQRPITLGIDVVVHSLTKGLSGFGIEMGGAVVTRREFFTKLILHRKDFGGTLAPQVAWSVMAHGLPTLALRAEKQQRNAIEVARFLQQHPLVEQVRYPGLESFPQYDLARRQMIDYDGNFAPGYMVYFILKGVSPEESRRFGMKMMDFIADNAYAVTLAVSLGQIRTLIEHPGSMTHSAYSADEQVTRGLDPGGIRLAVGIENPKDIIKDLEAALSACKSSSVV